jgi:hypothetical protein
MFMLTAHGRVRASVYEEGNDTLLDIASNFYHGTKGKAGAIIHGGWE